MEKRIGYRFRDGKLLKKALIHRSWLSEMDTAIREDSNERLEFLGDAVLELITAEYLYKLFPGRPEGELTEYRRILVNGKFLAKKARNINLGEELLISPSEKKTGGREKDSILSDAYEALIAAIYLDGGLKAARCFLEEFHLIDIHETLNEEENTNYKGKLLENLQARGTKPQYSTITETGPDHDKKFEVIVSVQEREVGKGTGFSKKEAEQQAAKNALEKLIEEQTAANSL